MAALIGRVVQFGTTANACSLANWAGYGRLAVEDGGVWSWSGRWVMTQRLGHDGRSFFGRNHHGRLATIGR
jgi:hypothetical protein